jgi:hypothetical protein
MAMIQNYFDFSKLTKIVTNEAKLWGNGSLVETKPAAASMLSKYWKNVGISKYTPANFASTSWQDNHPWSAVYVSWIMTRLDSSFPKSSAHRNYAKAASKNRNSGSGGWNLFSLSREKKKIKAQIGDVLVKPRGKGKKPGTDDEERKYGATHGDLVWKVSGGKAYLAGGNLSQTNKTNITINLNSDGSYPENPKGYLVILKKM